MKLKRIHKIAGPVPAKIKAKYVNVPEPWYKKFEGGYKPKPLPPGTKVWGPSHEGELPPKFKRGQKVVYKDWATQKPGGLGSLLAKKLPATGVTKQEQTDQRNKLIKAMTSNAAIIKSLEGRVSKTKPGPQAKADAAATQKTFDALDSAVWRKQVAKNVVPPSTHEQTKQLVAKNFPEGPPVREKATMVPKAKPKAFADASTSGKVIGLLKAIKDNKPASQTASAK